MESAEPRSWLAVKGKSPEAVRSELHLRASSVPSDPQEYPLVGASSEAGWYLIVARGREHRLIAEPVIQRLSAGCEVLTCTVEEQEIFSAAAGWRDGRRVWSVTYEGAEAATDVVAEGDLPPAFEAIRTRRTAEAKAEDAGDALVDPMFEIAVETVRSVIGYSCKYGEASPGFDGRFVTLQATDRSWWQRLFTT